MNRLDMIEKKAFERLKTNALFETDTFVEKGTTLIDEQLGLFVNDEKINDFKMKLTEDNSAKITSDLKIVLETSNDFKEFLFYTAILLKFTQMRIMGTITEAIIESKLPDVLKHLVISTIIKELMKNEK